MKKILYSFLAAAVLMAAMCGCNLNSTPRSLEKSIEIPEEGTISASVFEALKEENKVTTFYGTDQGLCYEWTVFGSDIQNPEQVNMKLEILHQSPGEITFRTCSDEPFGFTPLLSLHASSLWNCNNAVVCKKNENGGLSRLCSASVTGSKTSVLNFSLTQNGTFTVSAENTGQTELPENPETNPELIPETKEISDPYLSLPAQSENRVLSDGKQEGQDRYLTDPVPEGKPMPAEPEDQQVNNKKTYSCTFSIECSAILNNLGQLNPDKLDVLPENGILFPQTTVTVYEGESVYDVLQRICKENKIQMEASWTPIYNSAYVEGIGNLYEFDCGSGSGWMYRVDGWYPNYGCSRYRLSPGETVEWRYTCDLGADVGGGYAINPTP